MSKTAIIFPGQGSQAPGMGLEFYESYDVARKMYDTADSVLGYALSELCFHGPRETLNLTANTQPALLTTSAAITEVLRSKTKLEVAFTAGHSLGEYTALWFSGALSFETAVRLVHQRGKYMQEATPPDIGAMAAIIGLDEDAINQLCREAAEGQILQAANFNSPGQTVISGHREAIERSLIKSREMGAKRAILLPVSAPFHCSLMLPAQENMQKELENAEINSLQIPVVNNVDAKILGNTREAIIDSLVRQISNPVRWEQSVRFMVDQGADTFIEIGSGRVLTNLVKRIAPKSKRFTVNNSADLDKLLTWIAEN